MIKSYLLLSVAALLPVIATILFFILDKYTVFNKLKYWAKQIIYGVIFGGLAIVGTHWGINFNGATANARDAAVIIGGLIFGGPAGLIAGTIGGIERLIVGLIPSFNLGFTVIACSVSTFLAGVIAFLVRKFVFENKIPGPIHSFFVGFVIETFHLLMVFVTNASQYQKAYKVIENCSIPMLIANSFAVFIGVIVYHALESQHKVFQKPDFKSLSKRFAVSLSGLTIIIFLLSTTFVSLFQTTMGKRQTQNLLVNAITDVEESVSNKVDQEALKKAYSIKELISLDETILYSTTQLSDFCISNKICEINVVDSDGWIQYSSEDMYLNGKIYGKGYDHFNISLGEQSKEFECLLEENGPDSFVQEFRPMTDNEEVSRKYVGVRYSFHFDGVLEKGFIQVAFNENQVANLTATQVTDSTAYTHVGESGSVIIYDYMFNVVSKTKTEDLTGKETLLINSLNNEKEDKMFKLTVEGKTCYVTFSVREGYYIVSLIPVSEAQLMERISIVINTFIEIIVFGLFFILVYYLIKRLVIDRIEKTNQSLNSITNGNLKTVVEKDDVTEFDYLATGINETVDALKGYIDQANKRIDEELALAKAIQSASLPTSFPNVKEYDIYASMHPAKQVGGDFYDFYYSNLDIFNFTIADVSGKGIPAALFMMRAKSVLKSFTQSGIAINDAFTEGNNTLCDGNEAGMFVTAWSSSINLRDGLLKFANGGHNPPLLKRANGQFEYIKSKVNLVLAAMPGIKYGENQIQLEPGDIVYLYTDGVTEGVNKQGEQLGESRLKDILNAKDFNTCKELCEYVYEQCVKFADGVDQYDDITMIAFKYYGK